MSNFKTRFSYFNQTAASIAASPAWTLLGILNFPVYMLILNSNSNATVEFSIDGVNPIVFMQAATAASPTSIQMNLKEMGIVIPENTRFFARRINAGVTGNLRVTAIGPDNPTI